jgi:hypothetical protein
MYFCLPSMLHKMISYVSIISMDMLNLRKLYLFVLINDYKYNLICPLFFPYFEENMVYFFDELKVD